MLFVPDQDTEAVKHITVKLDVLIAFFTAIAFLLIAALAYCFILTNELNVAAGDVSVMKAQLNMLAQERDTLFSENETLQEKVTILSDTVNDKVHQEEEREERDAIIAQTYIPRGFPIRGTASYNEGEKELDGNPIAMFHVTRGTSVIASANGTVSAITGDAASGYILTVDHKNGYCSIYRNGANPKVKEGDEVTNATELFNINEGHEMLGYQITEDGVYIDPLEFMELSG